jgi:ribosomal protein L40E
VLSALGSKRPLAYVRNVTTWICLDCAARNPAPGDCASCHRGPLLDARDQQVRVALVQQDSQRAQARQRTLIVVAAGVTTIVGAPVFFLLGFLVGPVLAIAAGAVTYLVLRAAFPYRPRFAEFG